MRKVIIGIGIALVIGLGLVFLIVNPGNPTNTVQKPVPKEIQQEKNDNDVGITQEKVEQVLDLQKNGANGTYIVNLLTGSFEGDVKGKVLSDTDCTADEKGVSRCHNEIELDGQKKITVVTPHNMEKNRCLRPGESVRLSNNKEGKTIIKVLTM